MLKLITAAHASTRAHAFLRLSIESLCAQVALFHIAAFYLGHRLASATVAGNCLARARAISLTTGMQVLPALFAVQQSAVPHA